ncbi:WPP domain-interacting protein 1 [Rhynchospora pubera]|uniref:WPP domain-interacting protein 1 n=1 Tax=Rhynchospora pubera TaxID=906938 RepID=A0AAV8H6W5_9POAL|nr:WPP domain-interacting protein 1 [Rhynchospora pubera]
MDYSDMPNTEQGTTSNGELGFHPNSVDLKSNGSLEKPVPSLSGAPERSVDTKKGKGLRKWRRIKREDFVKEGSVEFTKEGSPPDLSDLAQLAQMHKRRIPLPDSSRSGRVADEREDLEGEGSVASVESRNMGLGLNEVSDYVAAPFVPSKSPEVEHPLMINGPPLFSIGAGDSDNSEDRSSKSSTAASVPRARYDILGVGRERGRHKGYSLFSTSQRGSRSKGEVSRSHRFKAEVENSNSNSNAVSNGKHSDISVNYDGGENSDDGLQGEEVRSGHCRENGGTENSGQGGESDAGFEEEKGANSGSENPTLDPFVESVLFLQTAQDVLEAEIKKFTEIEEEATGESEDESPDLNFEINELTEKTNSLESKLKAALAKLREKDLKLGELQSHENQTQMQPELDQLFQEKLAAEINSLVISKTTQKWRRVAEDQNALYNETKSLSLDHKNLTVKLRETERMEVVLRERVEELTTESKEKSCTIEVLKFKNLTYDTSLVFFMELVLMVLMMLMFIMHILPPSSDIVPT